MIQIHPVQTGYVKVKQAQRERRLGGLLRTLTDQDWTEWLPIHSWLIEHPEGLFLVDTGETARSSDPDYFPGWHPYYRWGVRTRVAPDEEIGPQLRRLGFELEDVGTVILTHLHTDHMGGIPHFRHSRFLASPGEVERARGVVGALRGYLPQHLPDWFAPESAFAGPSRKVGPFDEAFPLTSDGSVLVVPTPGHTPGHLSVVVTTSEARVFLAGDTSYTQETLMRRVPDGVTPAPGTARRTLDRILGLASDRPLVYLPSHDPEAEDRLRNLEAIPGARVAEALATFTADA